MMDGEIKDRETKDKLIRSKSLFENEDGTMSFLVACSYCDRKCRAYVTLPSDIDDDKLYRIRDVGKPCAYRNCHVDYSVHIKYLSIDETAPGSNNYLTSPLNRPYYAPRAGNRYTFTCSKCKDKHCTIETSEFAMPTNCLIGTAAKKVAYVREDLYEVVEEE